MVMINKIVKMKRILVILVAAMVCAVTSCNKEEVLNSKESVITTVKFAIEGSEQTRTTAEYISGFGFKFSWNDDEQVYVIPAEVGNSAHSKFSYNADKGIFEYVAGGKLEVGKKYYAVTNSGLSASNIPNFNKDKLCAIMELTANGSLESLPMVTNIFTADAEGTFATFHHLVGVVEIPVTGTGDLWDIGLSVYESSNKNVRGKLIVNFDGDEIGTVEQGNGGYNKTDSFEFRYKETSKLTLSSTPHSLFFPAFPGVYDYTQMKYMTDGENYSVYTENLGTLTVERGKINKKSTPLTIN